MWLYIYIHTYIYPITFPWCSHYESPADFHMASMAFRKVGTLFLSSPGVWTSSSWSTWCSNSWPCTPKPLQEVWSWNLDPGKSRNIMWWPGFSWCLGSFFAPFGWWMVMVLFSQSCAWPFGTPAVEFWGCGHLWPFWLDGPGNWLLLETPVACREVCIVFFVVKSEAKFLLLWLSNQSHDYYVV